jgi:hypothetical protein
MMATALAVFALVLSVGCAKKPELADVQQYLASGLEKAAPYRVGAVVVETESGAEGKAVVKFKAELVTDEPLYVRVGAAEELAKTGWKEAELDSAIESAAQLPADLAEKVEKAKPKRAADLVVLKQSVAANEKRVWYGTVDAKYLVDRWSFANLATEKRETFDGQKRASFPSDAIVLGSPEAPKAFEEAVAARRNYIEAIASAQAIVKERGLREDAEKQAAAEIQRERQTRAEAEMRAAAEARSRQAAEQQAEAARRKMPVQIEFRKAAMGRGNVAVIRNTSAEMLELGVTISDGFKVWRKVVQVRPANTPGSMTEIGWAQGWDFKSGDALKLEHRYYLAQQYRAP